MDTAQQFPNVAPSKSLNWIRTLLMTLLVFLVLILSGVLFKIYVIDKGLTSDGTEQLNPDQYTAVFLENGQVYFGKVISNSDLEIQLTGVYFLRVDQVTAEGAANTEGESTTAQAQPQLTLVKRQDTLHKPLEPMTINKTHVILTEPLAPDSDVITAIKQLDGESKPAGN